MTVTSTLRTHVNLSDVEHLAGADETSADIYFYRSPKNVIRLFERFVGPAIDS